jgi:hypothetical protein
VTSVPLTGGFRPRHIPTMSDYLTPEEITAVTTARRGGMKFGSRTPPTGEERDMPDTTHRCTHLVDLDRSGHDPRTECEAPAMWQIDMHGSGRHYLCEHHYLPLAAGASSLIASTKYLGVGPEPAVAAEPPAERIERERVLHTQIMTGPTYTFDMSALTGLERERITAMLKRADDPGALWLGLRHGWDMAREGLAYLPNPFPYPTQHARDAVLEILAGAL